MPSIDNDRYVATDGTTLRLSVGRDRGAPKAIILAIHGFGDYRKAWEEPAEIWAADGITTFAYDQRGFGSSATPQPLGRYPDHGQRHRGRSPC